MVVWGHAANQFFLVWKLGVGKAEQHLHGMLWQHAALASSLKSVKSEISDPLKSATSEIRGDPLKSATSEIRGRQSRAAPAWDAVAAQESARRSQETG